MKLKNKVAISESGFLFDSGTGESFNLNSTGQFIVKLISSGKETTEITNTVIDKYDVDLDTLQRYLDDFFQMLSQLNLLEIEEL